MSVSITFATYFIIIFSIAVLGYRATKSHDDFVLGSRHLGSAVTAMGVGASDMGSWLMLALPGAVYLSGLNQIWIAVGLSVGAYFNWRLVAKRLRAYTEIANNSLTIPAYFKNRFHDPSRSFRLIIACIILFFFTIYSAAGLVGGATLFVASFNVSYPQGLLICALIVVTYTSIGGFLAVNWIDLFQGTLMLLALLMLPALAFYQLGGGLDVTNIVNQINPAYSNVLQGMTAIGLLSLLGWGLGYFGQPHILMRFMAARNLKNIDTARKICMSWMVLSLGGAVLIGYVGIAFFAHSPLSNQETVFLDLSGSLFYLWIVGILMAAVLSAILSTIAAQLLASSSALAEDGYRTFIRKNASQKELIWIGRLGVVMITVVAFILAYDPGSLVLDLVAYAWAGLGATFGPPIIISLFWSKMTSKGAILGMILGAATVITWNLLGKYMGGFFNLYEIIPGFIASMLGVFWGSHVSAQPNAKILKDFNQYQRKLHIAQSDHS